MSVEARKDKPVCFGMVFVMILMIVLPLSVQAKEFTADIVIKGGRQSEYRYIIYVKDKVYRIQKLKGPQNIPPYPSIVNLENNTTWGLNPQLKKYVEIKDIKKTMMINPLVGWSITRQNIIEQRGANETLNGYDCKVSFYKEKVGSKPVAKVWFSQELDFIIREERYYGNKTSFMEFKNIQEGSLNQDLFEIPSDFVKIGDDSGNIKAKPSGFSKKDLVKNKPHIEVIEVKKGFTKARSLDPKKQIIITARGADLLGNVSKGQIIVKDKAENIIEVAVFNLENNKTRTWNIGPDMKPWILFMKTEAGKIVFKLEQLSKLQNEGVLMVKATKNNQTLKAFVKVFRKKDAKYIGGRWSLEDGTGAKYKLPQGHYYLKIQDPEERTEKEINDVIVQSGKIVTFNVKFPFKSGIEKKGLNQPVTEIESHKLETADEPGNLLQSGDLFAGEIPMIKGSKIIKEMSYDANSKLDFEVNAGIEDILHFYKNILTVKGWQPGMSMTREQSAVLQLKKETSQIMIKVTQKNQKSVVNMILIRK